MNKVNNKSSPIPNSPKNITNSNKMTNNDWRARNLNIN